MNVKTLDRFQRQISWSGHWSKAS